MNQSYDVFEIIWSNNTPVAQAIIVVISTLLILALLSAWRHIWRYNRFETKWLDHVRFRLTNQEETEATPEDSKPARPIQLAYIMEGVPDNSIIGGRLGALAKIRFAKAKVNVNALQELSLAWEARRLSLRIPHIAVGFSMMLGLLGTTIGLTMMVQSLGSALPQAPAHSAATELAPKKTSAGAGPTSAKPGTPARQDHVDIDELRRILGSMKTAFSATLVGLLSAIIAGAANAWLGGAQARYFERLERFTTEQLLPAVAPSIEDETLLEQVTLRLENSFDLLQQVSDQNRKTISDLDGVEKAFQTILGHVELATRNAAAGSAQHLVGQMTDVISQVTRSNASIAALTGSLPTIVSQIQRGNSETLSKMERLFERVSHLRQRAFIEMNGAPNSLSSRTVLACLVILVLLAVLIVRLS